MKVANRIAVRWLLAVACASAPAAAGAANALATLAEAARAQPAAPRFERHRFLVESRVGPVVLAPDGAHVAWLRENGRDRELWVRSTADGRATRRLANTMAHALHWTRDGRWLLLESPRQLQAMAIVARDQPGRPGLLGTLVATLGGDTRRELMMIDPVRQAAAIVREREGRTARGAPATWRLVRVDLSGRREVLHTDRHRIEAAAFDAAGRLALVQRVEGHALVVHRIEGSGRLREVLRCARLRNCTPLMPTPDGRGWWVRGHASGDDAHGLSGLMRLDADGRLQRWHVDPAGIADLDHIAVDPVSGQPAIAFHRSAAPTMHALTPAMALHLARLRQRFPDDDLRIEPGRTHWLLEVRGATRQQAQWHLYAPVRGDIAPLFEDALQHARSRTRAEPLPSVALARRTPVQWRASDGMRLHGFLSLPPGRDPRQRPLVVLVHGGPWNHARPDFSTLAQWLANRGYAVFEPNFRGSTGHGHDYMLAARGDFGNGRLQQDIVDGTHAMLDAGIGDPRRAGIVGASFGGYSALLGATFQPELFKVGVAFVPPPDFAWTLRWLQRNPASLELDGRVPMADWLRMLDLDPDDTARMARLHAQSPLANVARLRRPVLLVAGGEDRRVGIAGVIEYAARLKIAGKDVSLFVDDEAGHGTRAPLAREANLYLLEAMLHRQLGGDAPTPPDAALRAYLDRTRRLCGPGLAPFCAAPQPRTAATRD